MLDWSQKRILRFRNRCGISENAMDIFIIFGRVAALGHTYFRVLCCSLSMFLASVFCTLALHLRCGGSQGLWVLRAHGASTSHWWYLFGVFALRCGQTVANTSQAVWFGTFLQQLEWRWKASHRHFVLAPACGSYSYSVKSISGLLNVAFTSTHYCHILCGMSIHNIHLETGLCFA
jgi:hypothetical protein